jgi:hypothetical protein
MLSELPLKPVDKMTAEAAGSITIFPASRAIRSLRDCPDFLG